MTKEELKKLAVIKEKLGFDPTNKEELNKALNKYYGLNRNKTLKEELSIDDKPSIWSPLSLEESEWLNNNNLIAF